jgi:hypothetical protein
MMTGVGRVELHRMMHRTIGRFNAGVAALLIAAGSRHACGKGDCLQADDHPRDSGDMALRPSHWCVRSMVSHRQAYAARGAPWQYLVATSFLLPFRGPSSPDLQTVREINYVVR